MSIKNYLADRIGFLIFNVIVFIVICGAMFVSGFGAAVMTIVAGVWFIPLLTYIFFEYVRVGGYYNKLSDISQALDKKYLITEVVHDPDFAEGKVVHDVLKDAGKSMNEHVREYKLQSEDYRDYIETWVHEIKTPIASAKLIIDNNNDEVTRKISRELDKVDGFIEQVLYYSRSTDVSRDYIIKKIDLQAVIRSVIRANSKDFIEKRISLELDEIEDTVYMDEKWLSFIINQIIQNAIKYSKTKNAKVKILAEKIDNAVKLSIYDNGVGISERDLTRVFDKGFTGENGRKFAKSTGMGLYICKKLCDGLGIGIGISSKVSEFTNIELIIPIGGINNFN